MVKYKSIGTDELGESAIFLFLDDGSLICNKKALKRRTKYTSLSTISGLLRGAFEAHENAKKTTK